MVELKGETADKQMVDDVVKMIKARDMVKETVLLSLDYSLIQYITKAYPEMKTGYLYYFTTGNLKDLEGDYLIMEEREATPEKIEEVQAAGKKAIVWTVNTEESINTFIHSQADGVITDYVKDVQKAVETSKKRSDLEVLLDNLLIF
ncbi:glycerophosphodiester phosphodiesterase family protein [Streptococcus ferus]|uniref:glycerophosphodiester phosphodiesterase family protein n=1 Tax=Streptococcus ferus TaxID=1345 RepID=UPI0035A05CA3